MDNEALCQPPGLPTALMSKVGLKVGIILREKKGKK